MAETKQNSEDKGDVIYTLEKDVTASGSKGKSESKVIVAGVGTEKKYVLKWFEKKYKSQSIADALKNVAIDQSEYDWAKRYDWTSKKCLDKILTGNGRGFGMYCKRPWCPICLGIRKAMLVNQYFPTLQTWTCPGFLTLTAKSHRYTELESWVKYLVDNLNRILNKLKMRHYRGKGSKFRCLISLEVCYNPIAHTYNPHFHILTYNYEQAKVLEKEWLAAFPRKLVDPAGQYARKVIDKERDLKEVIKYGAKITTDPEMKKGKARNKPPVIYAAAIHEINKALFRRHLIRHIGFTIPKASSTEGTQIMDELKSWTYDKLVRTYVNEITGECMTKAFIPDQNIENIYEKGIDFGSR